MNMYSKTITPRINPQWESFPCMYILGKIPQGLPPTSLRCGVLRPTRILTLDLLPTSVPWTGYFCTLDGLMPEAHPCQLSHRRLNYTFGPISFTCRSSPWEETLPRLHGVNANNTKTTFLVPDQHAPSLFTLTVPLPSHLSSPLNHVLSGGVWFLRA